MTLHVETPLVKLFGNSVLFGDKLDMLPMFFQPLFFYPDWFFMSWPVQLFLAITTNGEHPYMTNMGMSAVGWSILWFILGWICGANGASDTFTSFSTPERFPVNRNFIHKMHCSGLFGQLLVLPLVIINLIYNIIYKFVAYLLFWHIVIARSVGVVLTPRDWLGDQICKFIRGIVYIVMLAPPLLCLAASVIVLSLHSLSILQS